MITVAQNTAVPLIPSPRGRFAALTVGSESHHLASLTPRLRSLGAAAVHSATTSRSGRVPRPTGPHDVCVLDAPLNTVNEELRALRAAGWRRVVLVAGRSESVRLAISSGVRSCVVPPLRPATMSVTPPRPSRREPPAADALSEREVQVLHGVAEGRTNRQIGEELCLSALTVKSHLARIARKLGTGDRAEMVAIGMRQGIVA
jgi:DNA-binding CsgD family transcriptional regulator